MAKFHLISLLVNFINGNLNVIFIIKFTWFFFSVFGLATLVFNGLEMAMHTMMQGAECLTDVVFVHPVMHGLFTFLQMHFLFVNSQASVGLTLIALSRVHSRTMRKCVSLLRFDALTTVYYVY